MCTANLVAQELQPSKAVRPPEKTPASKTVSTLTFEVLVASLEVAFS